MAEAPGGEGQLAPMLRLIPLASSSKANTTVVVAGDTILAIDAGLPRKEIIGRLSELGVLTAEQPKIHAMLLSHEHGDHAKHAGQWIGKDAALYMTKGTMQALELKGHLSVIQPMFPTWFRDVVITAIPISHDAADPVAWRVGYKGTAAVIATDLGELPPGFDLFCAGATDLLLEANYHPDLLRLCGYQEPLKARIASDRGHMDLTVVCQWIRDKMPATVRRLFIGHLSTVACDPKIARSLALEALAGRETELTVL